MAGGRRPFTFTQASTVLQEGTLAAADSIERLSTTTDETVAAVAARIAKRRLDEGP